MSRQFTVRFPDDLFNQLGQAKGQQSLSAFIVILLQQIVANRRPLLQRETALELAEYGKRQGFSTWETTVQNLLAGVRQAGTQSQEGFPIPAPDEAKGSNAREIKSQTTEGRKP